MIGSLFVGVAAGADVPEAACSTCHPAVAREWSDSLHHHSAGTNPWFVAALDETLATERDRCLACHAPATQRLADGGSVDCAACHPDVSPQLPHPTTSPTPCATCHLPDHPGRPGAAIVAAPTLPLDGPPPPETSCTGCHLPETQRATSVHISGEPDRTYPDRTAESDPASRRSGHSHRFAGTRRAAGASAEQRAASDRLSASIADLRIVHLEVHPGHVDASVILALSGTPHALPSSGGTDHLVVHVQDKTGQDLLPPVHQALDAPSSAWRLSPGHPTSVDLRVELPAAQHPDARLVVSLQRTDRGTGPDACPPSVPGGLQPCPETPVHRRTRGATGLDSEPGPRLAGPPAVTSTGSLLAADTAALDRPPTPTDVWQARAVDAALRVGATEAAATRLARLSANHPAYPLLQARTLLQAGAREATTTALQDARTAGAPMVSIHVLAGLQADRADDTAAALYHWRQAAVRAPTSPAILSAWARAAARAGATDRTMQIESVLLEVGVPRSAPGSASPGTCAVDATACPPGLNIVVRPRPPGR